MRAVDTNVLVRLLARDDAAQTSAAEAFVKAGAWVSLLALAEAMLVLDSVYERSPSDLATAIEMLLNHKDLSLQYPEVVMAALKLFHSHPSLGFSDCLMLQLARKSGHLPLGTFDRALGRMDGAERL